VKRSEPDVLRDAKASHLGLGEFCHGWRLDGGGGWLPPDYWGRFGSV
jgi:hypothetical protein